MLIHQLVRNGGTQTGAANAIFQADFGKLGNFIREGDTACVPRHDQNHFADTLVALPVWQHASQIAAVAAARIERESAGIDRDFHRRISG